MTICVNGCPKSGTHALLKACELLGTNPLTVNHIPFGRPLPKGTDKHVIVLRDPRNVVISWLRFKGKEVTEGTIIGAAPDLIKVQNDFLGWYKDSSAFVVKFEDLIASPVPMQQLSAYLGVAYLGSSFPNLFGYTRTWTGDGKTANHSDFKQYWTPAVENFWNTGDAAKLLKDLDYTVYSATAV